MAGRINDIIHNNLKKVTAGREDLRIEYVPPVSVPAEKRKRVLKDGSVETVDIPGVITPGRNFVKRLDGRRFEIIAGFRGGFEAIEKTPGLGTSSIHAINLEKLIQYVMKYEPL